MGDVVLPEGKRRLRTVAVCDGSVFEGWGEFHSESELVVRWPRERVGRGGGWCT